MTECIFCRIVKGTAPCTKVYEDKNTLAFLDIDPMTKGHTLVVSKNHFDDIRDIDESSISSAILTAKKIARKVLEEGANGVNIMHASGAVAGQSVSHFHLHVIPRYEKDEIRVIRKRKKK